MKILAIETSCDDTGIAILSAPGGPASGGESGFVVLANEIASQTALGKKYGGVFPVMAKREHQKNLVPTMIEALKKSGLLKKPDKSPKGHFDGPASISLKASLGGLLSREPELEKKLINFLKKYAKPDIDAIAVTNGPGLEPCLWAGVNFAKAISKFWNIPVVAVNHIESHILVNFLENPDIKFPAVALVVSGGHTQIILVKKIGQYKILGETRDDAAGECFDKCAKILGLGYPGGPIISKLAAAQIKSGRASPLRGGKGFITLPRPMFNTKDYDFSFSGLKTAVLYAWQKIKTDIKVDDRQLWHRTKIQMASEVQQAIIDVLIKKTMKAVKDYKAKSLILGGGVSANQELRKQFLQKPGICKVIFPKPDLSTDNGLMIAVTGYFKARKNPPSLKASARQSWKTLEADANLRIA